MSSCGARRTARRGRSTRRRTAREPASTNTAGYASGRRAGRYSSPTSPTSAFTAKRTAKLPRRLRRRMSTCDTPTAWWTHGATASSASEKTIAARASRRTQSSRSIWTRAARATFWFREATSTHIPPSARTGQRSLGFRGTIPTCPGTKPSFGLRTFSPTARSARPPKPPARRASPSFSRSGRRTASSISYPTERGGGICTDCAAMAMRMRSRP